MHISVDYLQNTAGDIALSYNDDEIYTVIRNAGIRAGNLNSLEYQCYGLLKRYRAPPELARVAR